MTKTAIWKYELEPGPNLIYVPVKSKQLTIKQQFNQVVIYFQVNSIHATEPRTVFLYMTGEVFELPINAVYLGSVMLEEGQFVLHCYVV